MPEQRRILAVCGERSGDGILKRISQASKVPFVGAVWSPPPSASSTLTTSTTTLFDGPSRLGVMGFGPQVLCKLPEAAWRLRQLTRWSEEHQINTLLTVDSNAFTWRLHRRVNDGGVCRTVHVCAPSSAWAFHRPNTATFPMHKLRTLLPFEPYYWKPEQHEEGSDVEFVGYFAVETLLDELGHKTKDLISNAPRFECSAPPRTASLLPHELVLDHLPVPTGTLPRLGRARKLAAKERVLAALPPSLSPKHLVALFPGSRTGEVQSSLAAMERAVQLIQRECAAVQPVVLAASTVAAQVRRMTSMPVLDEEEHKLAVLAGADAALAVSGTVVTELLLFDTPCAVMYNSGGLLTKWIALHKARVKHLTLVNIMAGCECVPEFFFREDAAEGMAKHVVRVLKEGGENDDRVVRSMLDRLVRWNGPHPIRPSHLVAREIDKVE